MILREMILYENSLLNERPMNKFVDNALVNDLQRRFMTSSFGSVIS